MPFETFTLNADTSSFHIPSHSGIRGRFLETGDQIPEKVGHLKSLEDTSRKNLG